MIFILSRAIVNNKTKISFNVKRLNSSDKLLAEALITAKIYKVINCLRISKICLLTFICSKCFVESNSSISPRIFSNMEF